MLKVHFFDFSVSHSPQLAKTYTNASARTLFVSSSGLENAKRAVTAYKKGEVKNMSPEIWQAKKIVDSTLHPGTIIGLSH